MRLRRRKSRTAQVADAVTGYLKFKAAMKAAKMARGAAAQQVSKRKPFVKGLPVLAGAGLAAFFAVRHRKGGGEAATAA